jgi:hypothetical protein
MLHLIPWLVWLRNAKWFVLHRHVRYLASWLVAGGVAAGVLTTARQAWDDSKRADGCAGHTSIDFGGSWIMGRMLVRGEGPFLYDRNHLRNAFRESYPRADENPAKRNEASDADNFMSWIMGEDRKDVAQTFASCATPLAAGDGLSAALLVAAASDRAWTEDKLAQAARHQLGGPLYPPINAFFAAPLGLFRPLTAYYVHQLLDLGLVLLTCWGVSLLSAGRIWAPVAAAILMLYPGNYGSFCLAQNSVLSLTILTWGWVLISRDRPAWGGAVWSLLAFKPVWAVSFLLVLVLSRRWRATMAMLGSGMALGLATLPFVGLSPWFDWFHVGRDAAALYNVDYNWIHLSRDLLSIPRRYLVDFDLPHKQRDRLDATLIGWALVAAVVLILVGVTLWKRKERPAAVGPRAAFLLLGGWLLCFHFMYYDVLLTFLPMMLLLITPRGYWRPRLWQRQTPEWARRASPLALSQARAGRNGVIAVFQFPPGRRGMKRRLAVLSLLSSAPYGWIRNPMGIVGLLALLLLEDSPVWLGLQDFNSPLDTYCLLILWACCGVLWSWRRTPAVQVIQPETEGEAGLHQHVPEQIRAQGLPFTPAQSR